MSQALPTLNSFGVFTVLPPFTITSVNYRCTSLQLLTVLIEEGVDVFNTYYAPVSLTNAQYLADVAAGVAMVTLESVDGPTLILPSSYVSTMPLELAVPYSRLVLSIDLGELPDDLSLTQLLSDLQTIANNYVGVTSIPTLHKIQGINSYSYSDYKVKEAARLLNVQKYVSFYTGKVNSDAALLAAKQQITLLEAALVAANKIIHPV